MLRLGTITPWYIMKDCIFCKIIKGELPGSIVHEDELCVAFLDIHPMSPGHILVVPRVHADGLADLPPDTGARIFRVGQELAERLKSVHVDVLGTNLLLNDGRVAWQSVPHLHLHVIPRRKRDGLKVSKNIALHMTGVMGPAAKRDALAAMAESLKVE